MAGGDRSGDGDLRLRLSRVGRHSVAAATGAAKPRGAGAGCVGPRSRRDSQGRYFGGQSKVAQIEGDVLGLLDQRNEPHLAPGR
jgi:hypothetical protein